MRRREFLAGAAGLGVLGGGAVIATGGLDRLRGDDARIDPLQLSGIEAPGSEATTVTVPEPGRVSFVEVFATWCHVCEDAMPELAAAHERVADDVQFVSVTNEPLGRTTTREDVAEWWAEHGGAWQVAADEDLELTAALDATGVPHAAVLDEDNVLRWSGKGAKTADELVAAIEGR